MENKITSELIEKARAASSVEELLALAKENGIELTEEEAKEYFGQLQGDGELSDDELENVAGGGCGGHKGNSCPKCGSKLEVTGPRNGWVELHCYNCGYSSRSMVD